MPFWRARASNHKSIAGYGVLLLSLLLSGCETVAFYGQALRGHWQILSARQPIKTILEQQDVKPELASKLQLILQVREFASSQLQLPVADNYLDYTDIHRSFVVWNVFAAPALSIKPLTWCYPVAGCVSYRGYFNESKARKKADVLSLQGYDVYVGGVAAYSTLGWLDDVVLNTFIRRGDTQLVVLIIHELAHQQLYIAGDTTFSESFARAVEIEGVRQWLEMHGDQTAYETYLQNQQRHDAWVIMLSDYRKQLDTLYQTDKTDLEKLQEKQLLFDDLFEAYQEFKLQWNNYAGYDAWMTASLNNAKLATVGDYNDWVPAFRQLFLDKQRSWPDFYERCIELSKLESSEREGMLEELRERFFNPSVGVVK